MRIEAPLPSPPSPQPYVLGLCIGLGVAYYSPSAMEPPSPPPNPYVLGLCIGLGIPNSLR